MERSRKHPMERAPFCKVSYYLVAASASAESPPPLPVVAAVFHLNDRAFLRVNTRARVGNSPKAGPFVSLNDELLVSSTHKHTRLIMH